MTLPRISASKLKTFRTCARQYQYKYVMHSDDRPEQDKNIGALLGTSLHAAFEGKYTKELDPVLVFKSTMTNTLAQWQDQGLQINGEEWFARYMKDGRKILEEFDWSMFAPNGIEVRFELPFPNKTAPYALMTGIIDLTDVRGYVVDHKSQKALPKQDELDNDPQFIIYAWAYRELYGELPKRVIWNHLRTNNVIDLAVTHNFEDKFLQLHLDIMAMIHNNHYQRKVLDKVCRTECSFYKLCYGGE